MNNIAEYLRDRYGKWGWMGQRAHDAAGINSVFPLDFIISCDYGLDVPYYFREEDVFSIEKKTNKREDWSNEHLKRSLSGSLGREIFSRWNEYDSRVNLICYRSVRKLEKGSKRLLRSPVIYSARESLKKAQPHSPQPDNKQPVGVHVQVLMIGVMVVSASPL